MRPPPKHDKTRVPLKRPLRMEPLEERAAPSASILGLVALSNLAGDDTTQIAAVPKTTDAVRTDLGVSLSLELEPLESRTLDSIFSSWETTENEEFDTSFSSSSTVQDVSLVSEAFSNDDFTPLIESALRSAMDYDATQSETPGNTFSASAFMNEISSQSAPLESDVALTPSEHGTITPVEFVSRDATDVPEDTSSGSDQRDEISSQKTSLENDTDLIPHEHDAVKHVECVAPGEAAVSEGEEGVIQTMSSGSGGDYECCPQGTWAPGFHGGNNPALTGGLFAMVSDTPLVYAIQATDNNEKPHADGCEDVQMFSTLGTVSREHSHGPGGASSYFFRVTIDISTPMETSFTYYVVDKHGARSSNETLPLTVLRIDDFEYEERAWGEDNFHAPEDGHVLWLENENRMRLKTTPQLNYDNPVSKTVSRWFFDNFTTTVTAMKWQWNAVTEEYVLPPTATFSTFTSAVGVYTLRVQVKWKMSGLVAEEIIHDDPYCFNRIQSVTWTESSQPQTILTNLDLADVDKYGVDEQGRDAYRIFREQNSPDSPLYSYIELNVALAVAIPAGQTGTVHLKVFDPANPALKYKGTPETNISGKGIPEDNKFKRDFVEGTWNFTSGMQTKSVYCNVSSGFAGDNYIVASHPNEGVVDEYKFYEIQGAITTSTPSSQIARNGSVLQFQRNANGVWADLPQNLRSPLLTVWRTLWIERDQMAAPTEGTGINQFDPAKKYSGSGSFTGKQWMPGNQDSEPGRAVIPNDPVVEPGNFDVMFQPALPLLHHTTEYFKTACVSVRGISLEQEKEWSGKTSLQDPAFVKNQNLNNLTNAGRDIDASKNTDQFWLLHALGAYESIDAGYNLNGTYYAVDTSFDNNINSFWLGNAQPNETILIYQEEIRDYVATIHKYVTGLPASITTMSEARERVMYHETLHYFVGIHGSPGADEGIMNKTRNSEDYYLFITANIELTPLQISKIQERDKPHV